MLTKTRTHIRWMNRRDMPEVLHIEQQSFHPPWEEEDFLRCLRHRNCIGMVAEQGEKVVSFMVYELGKHHLHLITFAVHPDYRNQGIGAQMVEKLVSKLSSHRRTHLTVHIRETNLRAQVFFRSQGFRATNILKGLYEDTGEDGYLMEYRLPSVLEAEEIAF